MIGSAGISAVSGGKKMRKQAGMRKAAPLLLCLVTRHATKHLGLWKCKIGEELKAKANIEYRPAFPPSRVFRRWRNIAIEHARPEAG